MTIVEEFRAITDELREDRRARGKDFVRDRMFMDRLDAAYDRMNDEEYLEVNNDGWRGWRGWPDQYDARGVTR